MIQKVLASIGIGNAKVDTKLHRERLTAGDVVSGVIEVVGGNVEQQIDTIYLTLYTTFVKEANDTKIYDKAVVARFTVSEPFTIREGEVREIPFSFNLPYTTPLTRGKTKVWIQTELDIKLAVDPSDKDMIQVLPSPLAANVLEAIRQLGFRMISAECERAPYTMKTPMPFIQEFEFSARNSPFTRYLDELELTFINQSSAHVELLLQIDRKARGLGGLFAEALDIDETFVRLTFKRNDLNSIETVLRQTIEKHMR
jgi:sporulation-control protein